MPCGAMGKAIMLGATCLVKKKKSFFFFFFFNYVRVKTEDCEKGLDVVHS